MSDITLDELHPRQPLDSRRWSLVDSLKLEHKYCDSTNCQVFECNIYDRKDLGEHSTQLLTKKDIQKIKFDSCMAL